MVNLITTRDLEVILSEIKSPNHRVIDVRTAEEWENIGHPNVADDSEIKCHFITLLYPDGSLNSEFIPQLQSEFEGIENHSDITLYFLCRSGGRSMRAAVMAEEAGFKKCYNIQDGFEGSSFGTGWKNSSLAWNKGGVNATSC